jgi:spectinomycin phosphotransferase
MLVRLHQATLAAASTARTTGVRLAERSHLEGALRDLDRPWIGGPFAEPARTLLARNTEAIGRLLEALDRLADRVAAAGAETMITHGEPHSGNLVTVGGSLVRVDWDTVGLALPERDLWMLDGRYQLARYAELSGRPVDEHAISLYRLRWQLDDLSTFVRWLRSEHQRTVDSGRHGLASPRRWRRRGAGTRLRFPPPSPALAALGIAMHR